MDVDVKPIRGEADYERALNDLAALWGSPSGTPEGDRLDVLATLINAYEARHHPMDPPDPVEAIKFRMGQMGMTRRDLEAIIGTRTPHRRGAEPQARPVDRHDPAPARSIGDFGGDTYPAFP